MKRIEFGGVKVGSDQLRGQSDLLAYQKLNEDVAAVLDPEKRFYTSVIISTGQIIDGVKVCKSKWSAQYLEGLQRILQPQKYATIEEFYDPDYLCLREHPLLTIIKSTSVQGVFLTETIMWRIELPKNPYIIVSMQREDPNLLQYTREAIGGRGGRLL